ncbi:NAD(P)H-hydrate epimerase [Propionibacterium australiense]|uniref:Bifunctional NAD(P)H-hydrate repair enzyme n=1 Tax=Propionibacterium australiense TaxID=119981 RepID=A0A383S5Q7_9ACTN|nr:NAD(P)H-hydrate epimerase [Propionibacterium australiense]RLP08743.1 NAD(P)H-hydrate epimerase [Propionibacterium australiense]SYZ33325.1 NAD(P)H-hydrate epimerase/ADP-dependent NAD(P)H-hydrate dehydratase [Propionibacterium australiense]VEH89772.1 Nicotinamide nucleotide repair protein [Propionibacterium australiense]
MRPVATAAQIRAAEQAWFDAHPGQDLMETAASHVSAAALDMLGGAAGARVLVVVGPGNNGGDGLYAARDLAARGVDVALWFTAEHRHESGSAAAAGAGAREVDAAAAIAALPEADLVVDAVLGIGGRPGLRRPVAEFARACTDLAVPVLAVDVPSGLDADLPGAEHPACFTATRTVTFGALKPCHVAQPAAGHCGRVEVADIGITVTEPTVFAAERCDVAARWPVPGPESDKYARGVLGIDTGSARYPGAGVLTATGALYAGAGFVRCCAPDPVPAMVTAALPSVTVGPGRVQAWVVGSGWGEPGHNAGRLAARLGDGAPLVLDADALAELPTALPAGCLATPHAGELARMLGRDRADVVADPVVSCRAAADRFGVTVLLKGATQYVAEPGGRVTIALPGPAWTAQAGSGDTLAGICGTLLAAGMGARWAGVLGASVQALAAAAHPGPYPPDELARTLPALIARLADEARLAAEPRATGR